MNSPSRTGAAHNMAAEDSISELDPSGSMSETELDRLWMLGLSSDRSLGRPKEWNGKEEPTSFDNFAHKFANWLSSLPGEPEALLDEAATRKAPMVLANLDAKKQIMARGAHQALRSLVDSKALAIVRL